MWFFFTIKNIKLLTIIQICSLDRFVGFSCTMNMLCEGYSTKKTNFMYFSGIFAVSQIIKLMGPTWDPPGSCRPQMGPMLAPWTMLSGYICSKVSLWLVTPTSIALSVGYHSSFTVVVLRSTLLVREPWGWTLFGRIKFFSLQFIAACVCVKIFREGATWNPLSIFNY